MALLKTQSFFSFKKRFVSTQMLWNMFFVFLFFPVAAFSFPNTMWKRPANINEWTNPLDSIWKKTPAFKGTISQTWPKIPIKNNAKVLCIGNSLSGWGAPIDQNLSSVYKYFNPTGSISVTLMGRGMAWLRDYIAETELGILDSIRSGRYDFLICQPWNDAMWPRSGTLDENKNLNIDSLKSQFVNPSDSLYKECAKVGTQMVIWSPNGSQFDDRLVYMTYSAFNCKKIAKRLNIPLVQSVEVFDSLYLESNDSSLVWYDAVHESTEMSAITSVLLYSVLKGGIVVDGMPQNWLDVAGNDWKSAYLSTPRTIFKHQDLLTKRANQFVTIQKSFNTGTTAITKQIQQNGFSLLNPIVRNISTDLTGRNIPSTSLANKTLGVRIINKENNSKLILNSR